MRLVLGVFILLAGVNQSSAQTNDPGLPEFGPSIQDNSFFIEEAYNQEPGVVQHISAATLFTSPQTDIAYGFTQEWPVGSEIHQLSFTIPFASVNSGAVSGVGDVMINYRYQLAGGNDWAAISPRLSVILPTGNEERGLGAGVMGVQVNLPASRRWSELVVTHWNIGGTVFPGVDGSDAFGNSVQRTLTSYFAGGSVIFLATQQLNMMLEAILNVNGEINEDGTIGHTTETIISPGLRYAIDVGSLQIVPGLGIPLRFESGRSHAGMFLYLSFEHPF